MKKFIALLLLPVNFLWAVNLLPNGDFQQIKDGRLLKWQIMSRWAGKSDYRHVPGTACIERPEDDKGAGAYMSNHVPAAEGKSYTFSVEYKLNYVRNSRCDLAVNWYDLNHKKLSYNLIRRVHKGGSGVMRGKVTAPAGAAFARILLVMGGSGSVEFANTVMDDGVKIPEAAAVTTVDNLLKNADFKQIKNGIPLYWSTSRWPGKTEFAMQDGLPVIRRQDGLDKAGAFVSMPAKVENLASVTVGGEIKTSKVSTNSDISIQFFDRKGKRIQYHLIGRVKGNTPWKKFSKLVNVPSGAATVRMLLVQCGTGETVFRNPFVSGKAPEVADPKIEASLILNGSFEEADLDPVFADCFSLNRGKVRRISEAAHGFHALELAPGSEISYGTTAAGAFAVKGNEKLFFSFSAAGEGRIETELLYFNSASRVIAAEKFPAEISGKKYSAAEKIIRVPAGAAAASLIIRNCGKNPLKFDALHLGKNRFDGKKVSAVPKMELPAAVPGQNFPASSVKDHNGTPSWFIDGKAVDFSMFTLSDIGPGTKKSWYDYIGNVLKNGQFPVLVIPVYITAEKRGERYTFDSAMRDIDIQIRTALSEIPDARFILWTMLEPSNAFGEAYPDDIIRLEDATLTWKDKVLPYSYGSEIWGRKCAVLIGDMLNAVAGKPYGSRIVGVSPGMGKFGENNFGHATTVGGYSPHDFSPAMVNFFRKWLFKEYKGDVLAFADAWNRPGMNFTEAVTPGMIRRLKKDHSTFFNPKENRQSIDYVRCESFAIMHRVLQQCEAVKKISGGRLFTFTQFAYFTGSMFQRELDCALKNPYLDAMGPAPPYINRGPGDDIPDHGPAASVQANGKVWLFQADVRTHLSSEHNWKYGRTYNENESVAVFLRDLGHYMCTGTIPYYMTFERWYDSPKMMGLVKRFNEFFQLSSRFPRRSAAEIAVVIDPVSLAVGHEYSYIRRIMPPQQSTLEYNRTFEWHKLGAPYDFYMLDDLLALKDLSRYKVVIFAANYVISDSQRKLIREKLHKDGRTLIWFFAPGIFQKEQHRLFFDEKNARISGFDFEYDYKPGDLEIKLPDGRIFGKFTTDIYGGFTIPTRPVKVRNETFRPRLIVKNAPGVEILGRYAADGKAGFARLKGKNHTDIFWGSSALNKEVLLPLLKAAGVHLYTDRPAVVYANKNFLSCHTAGAGKVTVTLPEKAEVIYDLYQEKILAENTGKITLDMAENSSVLLYSGKLKPLSDSLAEIRKQNKERETKNQSDKAAYAYSIPEIRNLAKAVDPAGIFPLERDGSIRHWQILWSFPGYAAGGYGFDRDFIGETAFAGDFSREYPVEFAAGEDQLLEKQSWFKGVAAKKKFTVKWQPWALSQGMSRAMYQEVPQNGFHEYITYYAACFVISEKERELILSIGSDDGEKSFFNGKAVTARRVVSRRMVQDSEQGAVRLKKGKNLLLLKVCQGGGGVGHTVRFLDPASGKPVTDLQITLK